MVTPTTFELAYNRPTVVMLRSEGLGSATLTASNSDIRSNTVQITYTFPWLFLLFSITGGCLGGTAKYFYTTSVKVLSGVGRGRLIWRYICLIICVIDSLLYGFVNSEEFQTIYYLVAPLIAVVFPLFNRLIESRH